MPGKDGVQEKRIPIDSLFRKIVLIREKLRVLEQKVNGNDKLNDEDRVQLQQVMLNLILNAADAMKEIYDRPRNLLLATAREAVDRVRLSVRDSGIGLDPRTVDRLFEAFYTTKTHGMGVGLSISRSIIESHEGRLWATANDGPGATFSFSVPCVTPLPSPQFR